MQKDRAKATDSSKIERRIKPVGKLDTFLSAVFYGRSGSGKTTLACDFPKPLLLLDINDRGTDSVEDIKGVDVLRCETWLDFEQSYWFLKNKGKYKTVVIDTVSMLQDLALDQVIQDKGGRTNGRMLTKQDWGQGAALLKVWLTNYRDLVSDMNVVFTAQDRVSREDGEDDDEGMITPEVGPRLMPSVASSLNAAVSLVGNTFVRERIKRVKTEDKKIVEKRKTDYCLRIGPHAYYTTKVRKPKKVEVPAVLVDPTYKELVATLKGE